MDKMPGRKVSASSAFKDASSTSMSSRQGASFIPTVSSVAEKFNFGLKEQLRKAEKDNQELHTKYQELLKSLEFISGENNRLKSSQVVLEEDKKVIESKYHKLKSHNDVMKADYDRVNTKLSSLEVANESLKQTSWIRRSKKGKGNSQNGASQISVLKEDLLKKDARIGELEKEVESIQEKLKQTVLETQPPKIKVEDTTAKDEVDVDNHHHRIVIDEAVLKSLDKPSIAMEYKKLLADYNRKEVESKERHNRLLSLEKSCKEQKKELLLLNMEMNKMKGDGIYILSESNNAHYSYRSSSVTVLGVPSSVVKSASFDNGRRISLPAHREATGSPDVSVLQNCLKLSLAEKKELEEEMKDLKQQLSLLKCDQSSTKSSRSHSATSPPPSPLNSVQKSSRSLSTVVSPKISEDTTSKSSKGDITTLQSCLQLAISEKKTLKEENEALKASLEEWQQKAKTLEAQLTKLEKSIPKREELSKLQTSMQSLEKENSVLLDNEKTLNSKVKSLDAKNAKLLAEKTQLVEEIEKLNRKLTTLNEKEKQHRMVQKHHKSTQTTSDRPLDRARPGSADSKGMSRVTFYRTNSQNSDPDVQADHKKPSLAEEQVVETKVEHKKKMQVAEGQAPEMKVACRLNITSHSPCTSPSGERRASPSGERRSKVTHTKSLSSDYNKISKPLSDSPDGEFNESKFLSSSQPAFSKPAVTSVKVSTSIKKETPTKINALHLRNTSPQLQVHSTSHAQGHTAASPTHTSTVISHSPTHSTVTSQTPNTRATSSAVSPSGNPSHSIQLGQQQSTTHAPVMSHVTPSVVTQSSVTSNPSSGSTTQPPAVTTAHQPARPRTFFKSNTMMSFVTSSTKPSTTTIKPSTTTSTTNSTTHSPLLPQKSTPATIVTPPLKSNPDISAPSEATKPPLQKTHSLVVSSTGTDVVRRRPKPRSQQILDPMKRSSAYFPTDVASHSIMEENELHRFGSLESLKSALFHAASAKVHPSVASSNVSSASGVTSVNTTASSTNVTTVTSTGFSQPTPKVVSFSKVHSPETKFDTKPAEAKKEVKFVNNNNQQASTRARPRAARHQSINTLPQVSTYYSPSTPSFRYIVL